MSENDWSSGDNNNSRSSVRSLLRVGGREPKDLKGRKHA